LLPIIRTGEGSLELPFLSCVFAVLSQVFGRDMSNSQELEDYAVGSQIWEGSEKNSKLSEMLSHLVFRDHTLRIGLELTAVVLLYHLLHLFFAPINPSPEDPTALYLWFASCIAVACVDQLGFCAPRRMLRDCRISAQQGDYLQALRLLEQIGPRSAQLIRVPQIVYHTIRSRIFAFAERFSFAEAESLLAENCGITLVDAVCLRTEALRIMGDCERANLEILNAREIVGAHACLSIEEGLCQMFQRHDMQSAKRAFETALALPESVHITGVSSFLIADAFLQAAKLWTGYAESALPRLGTAIDDMGMQATFQEGARSILSLLLLERAYYYATHREPKLAKNDLKAGLELCKYPTHLQKSKGVEEELKWRYDLDIG
jgi:hypothetical protein